MRNINGKFVVERVKKHLSSRWSVVSEKDLHEKGCDLVLKDELNKHKARRFLIECKGKSYSKSSRAVNETIWLYALGQLITRMKVMITFLWSQTGAGQQVQINHGSLSLHKVESGIIY